MTDLHSVVRYRRKWMLAGFAAAFLIGDMFLAVRGAAVSSAEFLYRVAELSPLYNKMTYMMVCVVSKMTKPFTFAGCKMTVDGGRVDTRSEM